MADEAYLQLNVKYGVDGVFNPPLVDFTPSNYALTSQTDGMVFRQIVPGLGITTSLNCPDSMTSINCLVVKNNSTTISIRLDAPVSTMFTNQIIIPPGGIAVIPLVSRDSDMIVRALGGATTTVPIDVVIIGV